VGQTVNVVVDTNVLVDALRGLPNAQKYLAERTADNVFCSVITQAELWAGARVNEKEALERFLSAFRSIPVDEGVARQAGDYMQHFTKSHGLLLPDALIAAAARSLNARLATQNTKHFPMRDIEIIRPY
jgi:predicted nucleic acid-binding protein